MYDKVFIALMNTNAAHWEQMRGCFEQMGLTEGQPTVLYVLRSVEGCVQKELAGACRVRESTLTVLLRKMEDKGYIRKEKVVVSGSKLANAVYLTDCGRELSDRIDEKVEELEKRALRAFPKTRKSSFLSFFTELKTT